MTDRVPGSKGRCMSRGGELGRLHAWVTQKVSGSFRFIECSPWHLLLSEDLNLSSSTYNATSMPQGTSAATESCFETTYRVPASEGRYFGNTREGRTTSDDPPITQDTTLSARAREDISALGPHFSTVGGDVKTGGDRGGLTRAWKAANDLHEFKISHCHPDGIDTGVNHRTPLLNPVSPVAAD
ncbi:hypothetical protein EDD18DRAFT_1353403 [Armillaria luteobubalina]|uniref:Uncharacterized protein n=1 Tax=Armillaria luteobubalina TaxID=153913 RepID=A0AA39Q5H2_9AGAR|nr:hypothetical protein EDD18DRAFT_1353403 [Armillaria luteobubalina]